MDEVKSARNKLTSVRIGKATVFYKRNLIDRYPPMGPLYFDDNKEVLIDVFYRKKKKTIKIDFNELNEPISSYFLDKPEKILAHV